MMTVTIRSSFVASLLLAGAIAAMTLPERVVHAQAPAPDTTLQYWEDQAFWEAIHQSNDPADFQAYLQQFPQGRHAEDARTRLQALQKQAVASGDRPGAYRTTANIVVRDSPHTDGKVVARLHEGEQVTVVGSTPDWDQIKLAGGHAGYVFGQLLAPVSATQSKAGTGASTAGETVTATAAKTFRDCPVCPLMTVIPAGHFQMGSDQHKPEERPVHEVTIAKPFALGVYEVTVGEWRACVSAGGCSYQPPATLAGRLPIGDLSWDDAHQYVRWLSQHTGAHYRLPSEAEWEYAARAGTTTDYWWGNDPGHNRANCKGCGSRWDAREPAPVGSFAANPFGLYDMNGNLWEWIEDCWHSSYHGAPSDGSAWGGTRECRDLSRVLRGGCYMLGPDYMRSSRRYKYDRDVRYYLDGVRVAKTLP